MAKIGFVAGERATDLVMKDLFSNRTDLEVTYKPYTLDRMIRDLTVSGIQLQELKSILIIDYAFKDEEGRGLEQKVAEQLVEIQDLMVTNMLNTKLYIVTQNSDLYDKLRGDVNGMSGTYYHGTQILLVKKNYKIDTIMSILNGERDNQGLYNKEALRQRTEEDRLEKEKDEEIERRKNLDDAIREMDKNTPTTSMTDLDYIDTHKRKVNEEDKKREQERLEKEKSKKEKRKKVEVEEPEKTPLKVNIQDGDTDTYSGEEREVEVEDELQELFNNINKGNGVNGGKLRTDSGVISFVGANDAGTSGMVANVADMYMMEKKKVLVIDMDFQKRMQTQYFKQYDQNASKQKGSTRSLIDAIQGYGVEESAVDFTDYLSVLSISKDEHVEDELVYALSGGIETLLIEAKEVYDIVLIDIPNKYFEEYLESLDEVDKNIFVVENKFYKVENFIEGFLHPMLEENEEVMSEFISKSNIVLNKFRRGMHDLDGYEINREYLRRELNKVGYPYDRIGVAGEIPFYEDWETQFFKGIRYVWLDDIALGVYRRVFDKVVV